MALDTKAKRIMMLNMASPTPSYTQLFEVDGAVDADDRGYLLHLYAGITFDSPIPITTPVGSLAMMGVGK